MSQSTCDLVTIKLDTYVTSCTTIFNSKFLLLSFQTSEIYIFLYSKYRIPSFKYLHIADFLINQASPQRNRQTLRWKR